MSSSYWRDDAFQEKLVAFLCRDRNFLRECAHLLEADDFKPRKQGEPLENWIIASKALEYWRRYHEPVGGMLRTEMLDYCRKTNAGTHQKERLLEVVENVQRNHRLVAVDALAEKVIDYKKERMKAQSIQTLVELHEQGKLTDERWLEQCYAAIVNFGRLGYEAHDYFEGLEDRILRRRMARGRRFPYLMIDPLDELIRIVGRGHVGLWLAYLKRGKSIALNHTSLAYILQGLNVLHFTLEDPIDEVENRFDSAITSLPIKSLIEQSDKIRLRFERFLRLVRSRLKIIDGTEGGISVLRIEEIWERERNRGFTADVVVIDYDDEIKPPRKLEERRFEFADIYRSLRTFAAQKQVIVWTAAQTGRKTENMKVITAAATAEDISKIRKATLAIGIGKGDWGENSRYLYVAAHKFDKMHVGCNIMGDFGSGIFYDREATMRELDSEAAARQEELGEEV
jgi:hypothetical protein